MKVLVVGATGFVGQSLIPKLLSQGNEIVGVSRRAVVAKQMSWYDQVDHRALDWRSPEAIEELSRCDADALVHLAWGHLDRFNATEHFESEMMAAYQFIAGLVRRGMRHVLVAGTCLEYGMQSGCLSESQLAIPELSYPLAKDCLRKMLVRLQDTVAFELSWPRIFYVHGKGQSERSLVPQLRAALDRGDKRFPMSAGEQIRDFVTVDAVAEQVSALVECRRGQGIVNVCSGEPMSVRRMVEQQLIAWNESIQLELGVYPYPNYEPFAFWGDNTKIKDIQAQHDRTSK